MKFKASATIVVLLIFSTNTNAALLERLDGMAYYDTDTNLTWLADANYAQTTEYDADGRMTWADANSWASTLIVNGIDGWRLPKLNPNSNSYYTNTELSALAYNVLGQIDGTPISQAHSDNFMLFTNILSDSYLDYYWIDAETNYGTQPSALIYEFIYGCTGCYNQQIYSGLAWAVHDGDVAMVPIPSALLLFASGILGLYCYSNNGNKRIATRPT